MARSASSDALSIMVMRFPERTRLPVLLGSRMILKKDVSACVAISAPMLNTIRSISAKIGMNNWLRTIFTMKFLAELPELIAFSLVDIMIHLRQLLP